MPVENDKIIASRPQVQEQEFSLKAILAEILHFWWLFVLFLVSTFTLAFLFLRYNSPKYKVLAKILVKDTKKGGAAGATQIFDELGLLGGQNSVDNEVELLKSRTLMQNTVLALQLNATVFAEGKIKHSEVFGKQVPFILTLKNIKEDSIQPLTTLSFHTVNDNLFEIEFNNKSRNFKFGDTIPFPFGDLVFAKSPNTNPRISPNATILINKLDNAVANYQERLTVTVTSKTASTIDIILEDAVPERGELVLNTLLHIYNQMNIEDKNRVADSTIAFIDSRLLFVTRELGNVEKDIEQFRQRNQLTNISEQGKLLLSNSSDYFKELSKTEVQISIVHSLENYLASKQNTSRTIPAGLVIDDPTFASLIEKYNTLQLEKERQLQTTTENNPVVQRLTVQISNLKADIISNLATIKRSMEITRTQLKSRTNSFENQIQEVPHKERAFLEISRQQAIKQELYLYLLKKREETAVSKAANIDNARIVDSAKSESLPFSPNKKLIYIIALALGIGLPAISLYFRNLLNNKVESKKDITDATAAPIVGEIGRSPIKDNLLVIVNPRHPIAEQFRLVRSNLDFMMPAKSLGSRVIMITSTISGEGKSFLSLNLASLLAIGSKKVALLEFDLRKPKLSRYLGLEQNQGLSNFLIGKNDNITSLAQKVPGADNLSFFGAGALPPNPAELINSSQTELLFQQLKNNYDEIIIDVPPVGVVTDALLLSIYTTITLYVVRQGYTEKNNLELIDELYREKKIQNIAILVNDVRKLNGYGYGYGYGSYGQEKM